MRIILLTGKGGVGKTSAAVATALRCADGGKRTLVMSTDAAHSLADALACDVGSEAVQVAPNLDALEVDVPTELNQNWGRIQSFVVGNLRKLADLSEIEAEELAVWPGMDELFSLLKLKAFHRQGAYDVVIMDCAPTGATVRMLSMPEVMRWYMTKVFHVERRLMKLLRPILSHLIKPDLPDEGVFDAVQKLYNQLDGVKDLLSDPMTCSVRLVLNPERMVIRESQRAFAYLSLFGFCVDAVVVNRLIPEHADGDFAAGWRRIQLGYIEEVEQAFSPLRLLRAEQRAGEILGLPALRELGAELYGDEDAAGVYETERPIRVEQQNGRLVMSIRLPFVDRGDLAVWTRADEMVIDVNNVRRSILLPRALTGRRVEQAKLNEGVLCVTFGGKSDERRVS